MTLSDYYANLLAKDEPIVMRAGLRALPKGRPRFSKGHAYTPQSTREFEAQIRTLGAAAMKDRRPYSCPVFITVVATEAVPASRSTLEKEIALAGYTVPLRGDLDNRVKAITDALNGIVYHDDVQIAETHAVKKFGAANLITVTIQRSGLSDLEIDRYKKLIKVNNGTVTGRSGPTMG
jgi:Holliday junction resolvase RusA-like endonuclease